MMNMRQSHRMSAAWDRKTWRGVPGKKEVQKINSMMETVENPRTIKAEMQENGKAIRKKETMIRQEKGNNY